MKRIAVLSAFIFCSSPAYAQQAPPAESKKDASATPSSMAAVEDARMKTLENQVRTLAEEVALLRGELKALRDANFVEPGSSGRVLLASSHVEPGMVPAAAPSPTSASAAPDPVPAQLTQTQTYGGASSNAKLLNPDISLIGDFIGTAGRNRVAPSPSLEMHESEVGLQAIIDPYARADAFISFGEDRKSVV